MRHLCIMMKHLIIFLNLILLTFSSFGSSLEVLEAKLDQKVNEEISAAQASEIYNLKMKFREYTMDSGVFVIKGYQVTEFSPKVLEKFKKENTSKGAQKYLSNIFSNGDGHGTGFLYKGYIVTNFHVCRGGNVLAKDYQGNILAFTLIDFNPTQDICILKPNFSESKYFDFGKDIEVRKVAQSPKEEYIIHSIYGNIKAEKLTKDPVSDEWTKSNSYVAKNYSGDCRGGISGSAVTGPKGFFGLAWGSSTEQKKETECYFVEKTSLDSMINSL